MFGSQILEVTIGLVLVYLVLSVGSSGIKELIAGALSLRASMLEKGIRNMFRTSTVDYTTLLFNHPLIAGTAPIGTKPSYISSRLFATALCDILAPADATQKSTFQSLHDSISQIPDQKLRSTLLNIIDAGGGDMDAARRKIENWFDDSMDRVSGWYKRLAQKIIFAVGLALCFAVNADTLMIVKELWTDQTLRSAVVASAEKKVQSSFSVTDASNQSTALQQAMEEIRATNVPPLAGHAIHMTPGPGHRRPEPLC